MPCQARENSLFLPGIVLHEGIRATQDYADLASADLWLAVPPAQHMRSTLAALKPHARDGLPVILCSKGVEQGSLKLMTEVLAETLPRADLRRVQTPQGFDAATLTTAYAALGADADLTDDAAVVRAAGVPVATVRGDERSAKVTVAHDLRLAELLVNA